MLRGRDSRPNSVVTPTLGAGVYVNAACFAVQSAQNHGLYLKTQGLKAAAAVITLEIEVPVAPRRCISQELK